MEDFTSALFLDAEFSHAYYSRGTLLRDSGQYLFALADFDKALRYSYPDPARLYVAEAATYEKLNRTADARASLIKALDAKPGYEPAQKRLAALDGAPVAVSVGDLIQTAEVSPASDLTVAKAPSASLMGEDTQPSEATGKLYTDRVPQEQVRVASAVPLVDAQPAAAAAEEKVLAVEEVPEDTQVAAVAEPVVDETHTASLDAAPAEEPAATKKITGWSVQLASATTEDSAWSTWKKMQDRNKALASQEPVVVRADLGSKGVFYRVRLVGFESQGDANRVCSKLKAKGVKCFISKASS
jgi:tetratricopeptide (TPR) repeat protein